MGREVGGREGKWGVRVSGREASGWGGRRVSGEGGRRAGGINGEGGAGGRVRVCGR